MANRRDAEGHIPLQELVMNRSIYFVSVVIALVSLFVVQSVGGIPQTAASVSSQTVAANPDSAAAPDSSWAAIDALASWPAGAGR